MQVVADLHLHSKYSRAVSKNMVPRQIATWAAKKGIDLVATGDWTHPLYFRQLQAELEEKGSGVYRLKKKWEVGSEKLDEDVGSGINASHISFQNPPSHFPHLISPFFLLGTELSCIYSQGGRLRRIHLLVFAPSFDVVAQRVEDLAEENDQNLTNFSVDNFGVKWVNNVNDNRPKYTMLVPLAEIIAESVNSGVSSQKVINEYEKLTNFLGPEFKILLQTNPEEIERVSGPKVKEAIIKVRSGKIYIDPGYDGVFGTVKIWPEANKDIDKDEKQMGLF